MSGVIIICLAHFKRDIHLLSFLHKKDRLAFKQNDRRAVQITLSRVTQDVVFFKFASFLT